MQVLVDTSVWSAVLRRPAAHKKPAAGRTAVSNLQQALQERSAALLKDLIADGRAVLIGPVRQELLSGIKSAEQYNTLRQMLGAFPDWPIVTADYEHAAQLFNQCQAVGVQGSQIDFLICAVAFRSQLPILTLDQDFEHFLRCVPIELLLKQRGAS
jgi:predicted nucleic acid-binding protein